MASSYFGQHADWIKHFQNWLITEGYKLPSGVDGVWGSETEAAYDSAVQAGKAVTLAIQQAQKATPSGTKPASTSTQSDAQFEDYIKQHYPGMIPLLNIPEIKQGLIQAAKEQWSPEKLQAWFLGTNYWKGHSQSQEAWLTLSPVERGQKRLDVATQMIGDLEALYGTQAFKQRIGTTDPAQFLAAHFSTIEKIASGVMAYASWQVEASLDARKFPGSQAYADEIQRQEDLATKLKRPQEIAEQLFQQAHGDYFVNLSKQDSVTWANNIIAGKSSFGEFNDYLRKQAATLYPFYKDSIGNGVLPKALFGPALNTLSTELETSPDAVIANSKLWGEITAQAAGTKGQFTAADWVTYARSLPEYKRTQGAATMTSDFADKLLREFGQVA